jgi:hypothetical protein
MTPEKIAFFLSQTEELVAQADRVRSLIKDSHWYTDGAFKEALLLDSVRRRLPMGMQARRGFVLSDDFAECSKEQDCIIHERLNATPVFEAVDFQIVKPTGVVGLVSVKTKFHKDEFLDALRGLVSALKIIAEQSGSQVPFIGAFFFDQDASVQDKTVDGWVKELFEDHTLPVIQRSSLDGDRAMAPMYLATLRNKFVRIDCGTEPQVRTLQYDIANLASALFLYLLERSSLGSRDASAFAAWADLEHPSVARLTSDSLLK